MTRSAASKRAEKIREARTKFTEKRMPYRLTSKLYSRKGNPIGSVTMFGKTAAQAKARTRQFARRHNIAAGFWEHDEEGRPLIFHPIRASHDYDPSRVRERRRSRPRGKKKSRKRRR